MKVRDMFFGVWKSPIGYIGMGCRYCGEVFADASQDIEKHVSEHVARGDVEVVAQGAYRPVIGRPAKFTEDDSVSMLGFFRRHMNQMRVDARSPR